MMTEPTLTASLKAAAWSCAACPIELPSPAPLSHPHALPGEAAGQQAAG